jgi:hypothetical protein
MTRLPTNTERDGLGIDPARELVTAVLDYDAMLRRYQGPLEVLLEGDAVEIDRAYDGVVQLAKSAAAAADRESTALNALRKICWLRPAGDVNKTRKAKDLLEQIEVITLVALAKAEGRS